MKTKRILVFLLIIIFLALISIYYPKFTGKSILDSDTEYQKEEAFVNRVIDGDTIEAEVNDSKETIRLWVTERTHGPSAQ